MRQRNWAIIALIGTIALVGAVIIGPPGNNGGGSSKAQAAPKNTNTACNKAQVVSSILVSAGFKPGEFTVGDKFDLTLPAAVDAGHGSFTKPLTTKQGLIKALGSGGKATEAMMATTVKLSGGTRAQALSPNNWVGFQLLTESNWEGNTFFMDGQVKKAGTRHSAKGDIGWMFINPVDCASKANVVRVALIRLGCGNPQTSMPKPRNPRPPTSVDCPNGLVPDTKYPGRCVHVSITEPDPCNDRPELNIDVCQDPQDNTTSGVDTGPTDGAPPTPYVPPVGPSPKPGEPAPEPTPGGYDGGSSAPGGTTCDNSTGCTSGESQPSPSASPTPVDDGTHSGDPGGF